MEIQEYKTIVEKTAIYPNKVDNFGLAYCWLGLIGETEEVYNTIELKDQKKEIGDVLWYTTAISIIVNLSLERIINLIKDFEVSPAQSNLINNIYGYSEIIKKYYRDGKKIDREELEVVLANNLYILLYGNPNENEVTTDNLSEIMQMNYDKLMKRRETNTLNGDGNNREEEVK